MGDWIWRHSWFVARTPGTALRTYERLEELGRAIDTSRDTGLITGVRFGLVSPTVVAATCTAKWGTHTTFHTEVTRPITAPLAVITGDTTEAELTGSIATLDPAYAFAWSPVPAITVVLRAHYPAVRFGAAEVFQLDRDAQELIYAGLPVAPPLGLRDAQVIVGVACHDHGLIALVHWIYHHDGSTDVEPASLPTRLRAIRTAGHGSWAITNAFDDVKHLPDSYLDRPALAALDHHDALALWRPPHVRRMWVDAGLASADAAARQAAAMVIRRSGWRDDAGALVDLMADPDPDVRAAASFALLELGCDGAGVRAALSRGLADVDAAVRARCATALDLLAGGAAASVRAAMTIDDREDDDGQRVFELARTCAAFAGGEINPWADHVDRMLVAAGAAAEPWLLAQLAEPGDRQRALELIERAGPELGCLPAVRDALLVLPRDGIDDALALPRVLAAWAPLDPRVRAHLLALDAGAADEDDREELIALQLGAGHPGLRAAMQRDAGAPGPSAVVEAVLTHPSPAMADLAAELAAILLHRPDDRHAALAALGTVWAGGAVPEPVRSVAEDVLVRWLGEVPVPKPAIRAVTVLAPLGVIGVPALAKMTTLAVPELAHVAALTLALKDDAARDALAQRWPVDADAPPAVRFALGRIPPDDTATLPALCARARAGGAPAHGFVARAREIAAGLGRGTYWRVRSGSPGRDLEPTGPTLAALVRAWAGDPTMKADRVIGWTQACAAAGTDVARLVAALDSAMAATCDNPSWITPPAAWIDHALAIAWDDGTIDPPWPVEPGPGAHDARVGEAAAEFERAEGLEAAAALPLLEEALALATASSARRLAERIRFRWLGQLAAAHDPRCVLELTAFLAELPPPMLLLPQTDRPEHTEWTANYLAWQLHERGDSAGARPISERAVLTADHDDSAVLDTVARIRLATGDVDGARAAVRWLERFCPAAPELAELVKLIP